MIQNRFELFTTAITQISRSLQKIKNKEMLPLGLRGAHVMYLFYLQQNKEGLTIAELSSLCEVDKGAVSRSIAELERRGYVLSPEAKEKRKYRAKITLSEAGKTLTQKIDAIIDDMVDKASVGLGEEERAVFYKSLHLIAKNLQELAST